MKIFQKGTVFSPSSSDPYSIDYIYNFNHGPNLVKLSDDTYLAAWFSGPWEGHPWQRILAARFANGEWSNPEIIQNTERVSDFDPAFVRTGEKVVLFYSNARWFSPKLYGEKSGFIGTYFKRLEYDGRTWSKPELLSKKFACKSNGICLENGHLLLPVYNTGTNQVGVYKSSDDGLNWELKANLPTDVDVAEPSIVELEPNHILMYIRTKTDNIWQSESLDAGKSWTNPHSSEIGSDNAPMSLLKHENRLLLCCNTGKEREKLTILISKSLNTGWIPKLTVDQIEERQVALSQPIHPSGVDSAVCYPSMIAARDSMLLAWSKYTIN